jgi:peptide/nickel transport system permease protein
MTREILLRLKRRPAALAALAVVSLHLVAAAFAPLLSPADPYAMIGFPLMPPDAGNLLGTDELGRDFLARLLHGGRTALLVAFASGAAAVVGGGLAGLAAARYGGWVDDAICRLVDMNLALPAILFVSLFVAGFGQSLPMLVLVVALLMSMGVVRTARAQGLGLMEQGYVKAAILRGENGLSVILREMLPNTAELLAVEFALRSSSALLLVSALSFLSLGISAPTPDWGLMIRDGLTSMRTEPWLVAAPAAMISSLVIAINVATEGLAEALGLEAARGGA